MGKRKHRRESVRGFSPSANPEIAQAMAQLRRSSAAQRHTPKPRKGTRAAKQRQAVRDQRRDQQN